MVPSIFSYIPLFFYSSFFQHKWRKESGDVDDEVRAKIYFLHVRVYLFLKGFEVDVMPEPTRPVQHELKKSRRNSLNDCLFKINQHNCNNKLVAWMMTLDGFVL